MHANRTVRKKIGELLIERGIINQQQLGLALEEQGKKGGYLSQHLIALGFATEFDIANCLANQYNFAYLPLKNYDIPQEVLEAVPLKWIKIYTFIPIDKIHNVFTVTMADPLNEGVIQMLEQITGCDVQVFISTYTEINEAINRYYGKKLQDMKEAYLDSKDMDKVKSADEFIQTKVYKGRERRRYLRINKELDISYYFYGKTFQAKARNISYSGACFISGIFIPIDTNLAVKIYLNGQQSYINVVLNILRVQELSEKPGDYEIAGMFDFITAEDRENLVLFLRGNAD